MDNSYGISTTTSLPPAEAEAAVREALAEQGFGILTEIDVQATLKAKLDIDREPYKILGACNPPLANRALEAEQDIGLLLPCNVIVYPSGDGSVVAAIEPMSMVDFTGNEELNSVATEAKERLEKALAALPS